MASLSADTVSVESYPDDSPLSRSGPGVRRAVMVQRWNDVVFLHWRYEPEEVQRLLPRGVQVDTFDGSAWVGLVPFEMSGLGVAGVAPLPFVGRFPEVNVRTYVRSGDRRGVWFFSLDIDLVLPTVVARAAYHLPYCFGRAEHLRAGGVVATRVRRRWPRAAEIPRDEVPKDEAPHDEVTRDEVPRCEVAVRTAAPVDPADPLVNYLTSRWGLISATRSGALRWAPVDHPPWELHHAEVLHLRDSLVRAAGLAAPTGVAHALWSPGVDVRVGRPVRLR